MDPNGEESLRAMQDKERISRKRLQDREHQRRHREKRKQKLMTLEAEVESLQSTVSELQTHYERVWRDNALQTVAEYFRVFQHGYSDAHRTEQENFLHSIMTPDGFNDMDGAFGTWLDEVNAFRSFQLEPKTYKTYVLEDLLIVIVDTVAYVSLDLEQGNEEQRTVEGNCTFVVQKNGLVSSIFMETGMISAMQEALGSLTTVSRIVDDAQLGLETQAEESKTSDPRLSVQFLLSD